MTAVASGTINDKKYDRLEVVKTNTSGDKLSGAGFRLKRLAEAGMTEKDMGIKTTATEGSIRFEKLTTGNHLQSLATSLTRIMASRLLMTGLHGEITSRNFLEQAVLTQVCTMVQEQAYCC